MSSPKKIIAALREYSGLEVIDGGCTTVRDVQLRLLCRVLPNSDRIWTKERKRLLLTVRAGKPWTVDISRWNFLLENTDTEVFAWRILLQASPIADHYEDIVTTLSEVPAPPVADVMEFPIPAISQRNMSTAGGHRGAGPTGSVATGPGAGRR